MINYVNKVNASVFIKDVLHQESYKNSYRTFVLLEIRINFYTKSHKSKDKSSGESSGLMIYINRMKISKVIYLKTISEIQKKLELNTHKALSNFKGTPNSSDLNQINFFILYDKGLFQYNPKLKNWIKSFHLSYGIRAGEKEKSIESFAKHLLKINRILKDVSAKNLTFIVLGGGSVGDLGGFIASVYKRGVRLVHIPTTWLAAIDSSHGGKTGLNISNIKNQLGTFYPADEIYLVKEILTSQPEVRAYEASGEIFKMALLMGGKLWSAVRKYKLIDSNKYWQLLPLAIKGKYSIVALDPFEKNGIRHLLNLGHTMGHVFESMYQLPHGIAVLLGLRFSLEWSKELGLLSKDNYFKIIKCEGLNVYPKNYNYYLQGKSTLYKFLLNADKKKSSDKQIRFIFIKSPGKTEIKNVFISEIISEINRQKYLHL